MRCEGEEVEEQRADVQGKAIHSKPEAVHKKAITWLEVSPNGKGMVTASTGE
jgi:hypothetical protein